MNNITKVKIVGMTCNACQRVIEKRVSRIDGVQKVKVSVDQGQAEIDANRKLSVDEIKNVLSGTDYQVISLH